MSMGGDVKTDIVEWLRHEVPHCNDPSDYCEWDLRMLEAADEIERLRSIIDLQAEEMEQLNKDVEFLEGQVERLQDMLRAALGEKE